MNVQTTDSYLPKAGGMAARLHHVHDELAKDFSLINKLVEQHGEAEGNDALLGKSLERISEVGGVCNLLEAYGVAALAREMYLTVEALYDRSLERRDPAYSAVVGACALATDYLELLRQGLTDTPIVLHPMINELRLARGIDMRSEEDLFVWHARNLPVLLDREIGQRSDTDLAAEAKRLYPVFAAALVSWLKGRDSKTSLSRIGRIGDLLAAASKTPEIHQIWFAVACCAEGILSRHLRGTKELQRQIGRASQLLKIIATSGEAVGVKKASDVAYRLLFHIGKASGEGRRIKLLFEHLRLRDLLPDMAGLEAIRSRLRGTNAELLERVALELRADLTEVRDNVDFAHRSNEEDADYRSMAECLERVSNTLRVLGLTAESQNLEEPIETLRKGNDATSDAWMHFATSVLQVELSLDSALYHSLKSVESTGSASAQAAQETVISHDLRHGQLAVYRESLVNIARVKMHVEGYLKTGGAEHLEGSTLAAVEVSGGLTVLGEHKAAELVNKIAGVFSSADCSKLRSNEAARSLFAELVSLIEYFIEFSRDGLSDRSHLLEQLSTRTTLFWQQMEAAPVVDFEETTAEEPGPEAASDQHESEILELDAASDLAPDPLASDSAIELPSLEQAGLESADATTTQGAPSWSSRIWAVLESSASDGVTPGISDAESARNAKVSADDVDPEIRDIFISEAEEILQNLQQTLPGISPDGQHEEALKTVRRHFHTLKGSGRIVGAIGIGKFAWAIEDMLNRVLDKTIEFSAQVHDIVGQAVALIPDLIAAFREGRVLPDGGLALEARARRLADGLDEGTDWELVRIFQQDSAERFDELQAMLRDTEAAEKDVELPRNVALTFHTVAGAARSAGAAEIGDLAARTESWLNGLRELSAPLSKDDIELLQGLSPAMCGWIADHGSADDGAPEMGSWPDQVSAQLSQVELSAAKSGIDPSITDAFCFEVFEQVQSLEQELESLATSAEPDKSIASMRSGLKALQSSARAQDAEGLLAIAAAIEHAMDKGPGPDALAGNTAFRGGAQRAVEMLYRQLDAIRDRSGIEVPSEPELAALFETVEPDQELLRAGQDSESVSEDVDGGLSFPDLDLPEADLDLEADQLEPEQVGSSDGPRIALSSAEEPASTDAESDVGLPGFSPVEFKLPMPGPTVASGDAADGTIARSEVTKEDVDSGSPADADAVTTAETPGAEPESASGQEAHLGWPDLAAAETVDPDLLEIFAPEATELLESIEASMTRWRGKPSDPDPSFSIRRDLHTFKGGARMSGLTALGDAAHSIETSIDKLERDGELGDDAKLSGIERAVGSLHQMYEIVAMSGRAEAATPEIPLVPAVPADFELPQGESDKPIDDSDSPAGEESMAEGDPSAAPENIEPIGDVTWNPQLFWRPEGDKQRAFGDTRREEVRVPVDRLDNMLNQVSELAISRSRLEETRGSLVNHLGEINETIARIREQLRMMDIETEAQISARGFSDSGNAASDDRYDKEFDPLEMDRYTRMQELARALAESLSDLSSLHGSLEQANSEAESVLQQQGRINTEVQQALMGTLMLPFERNVPRLSRVVRQTAEQNGKSARAEFTGQDSELDRNVLERMTAPLEHLLRNCVVHGIEDPEERARLGKPEEGSIHIGLKRQVSQLLIEVSDDGRGLDFDAIRTLAVKRGLMREGAEVSEEDLGRFIFSPGFSTAKALTQDAGRGIGMDVVSSEVKQLGGTVDVASEAGKGTRFQIRLPLMLALQQTLTVAVGDELFAIPLTLVEGIARMPRDAMLEILEDESKPLQYGGRIYRVNRLGRLVGLRSRIDPEARTIPAILMRLSDGLGNNDQRVAIIPDRMIGNREIVVKPAGPVLGGVPGVSGATILADGRVMLILDVRALIQESVRRSLFNEVDRDAAEEALGDTTKLVMVVDDSITIRRVTERLLSRRGFSVVTAKDGVDAMSRLQTLKPDVMLLDIEMPRADGFEVAAFVRNNEQLKTLPIIMITSRSGEKHREHARNLGVDRYLIKPYQEDQLLGELQSLLGEGE